jgi:hypothetical protein
VDKLLISPYQNPGYTSPLLSPPIAFLFIIRMI